MPESTITYNTGTSGAELMIEHLAQFATSFDVVRELLGEEDIPIVKERKPRKKKEFPAYSKMEHSGGIEKMQMNVIGCNESRWEDGDRQMTPFSELIPLIYLNKARYSIENHASGAHLYSNYFSHFNKWKGKQKEINELYNGKKLNDLFYTAINYYGREKNIITQEVKNQVNDYLQYDKCISLESLLGRRMYGNSKEGVMNHFKGKSIDSEFYFRSYTGYVSPLSMYLDDENNDMIPYIMAVVLPENYIYQKLNIIKNKEIDLNKIIILVDRELDSPDFPNKAFRTFYKQEIEPYLTTLTCDVWKVPTEYIIEKCFLPKFRLKEKNVIKRKAEIEGIIKEFINNKNVGSGAQIIINTDSIPQGSIGIIPQIMNEVGYLTFDNPTTGWIYNNDAIQYSASVLSTDDVGNLMWSNNGNAQGEGVIDRMRAEQIMYNTAMNQLERLRQENVSAHLEISTAGTQIVEDDWIEPEGGDLLYEGEDEVLNNALDSVEELP